ncbi:MAG: nitrous oxide-stimulated promoter family protein [Acholeplasmataceae bacterium]|jgi:hypothetical protein
MDKKVIKEKKTFDKMLKIYCKKKHSSTKLCTECVEIQQYAHLKIEKCPFISDKPFCAFCKVQCYQKDMKEKIREIMKFSGPKMIFRAPIQSFKHIMQMIKHRKKKGGKNV